MLYDLVIEGLKKQGLHYTPSNQWVNNISNWYVQDKHLRALFDECTVEDIPGLLLRNGEGELACGPATWRILIKPILEDILK